MGDDLQHALNASRKGLHEAKGRLAYHLELFGDFVAQREKYKTHTGYDALYFYLVSKYNWLPSVVRAFSQDDLEFLLAEEMKGWTVPKDAL